MGSLVGFVAYIYALTHLSTSFVSLYAYINPVVAVVLGTVILDEPFGWRLVIAIGIILGGMAIVSAKRRAAPSSAAAARSQSQEPAGGSSAAPAGRRAQSSAA
jgi:drug/metabolite transporter (DMT)-like permease